MTVNDGRNPFSISETALLPRGKMVAPKGADVDQREQLRADLRAIDAEVKQRRRTLMIVMNREGVLLDDSMRLQQVAAELKKLVEERTLIARQLRDRG
jgi:hypothetical protein